MSRTGYNLGDIHDLGSIIKSAVENIINNEINAPFIGRVMAVKNNKVDVMPIYTLMFNSLPLTPVTYYSLLVGNPLTGKASTNNPCQIGDIGLCIVTDRDISNYASTGMENVVASQRRFSKMDSIFIPLSMYKQENMAQEYVFTFYGTPQVPSLTLTLSNNNTISLQAGQSGSAYTLDIDEQGVTTFDIGQGQVTIKLDGSNGCTFDDTNKNNVTIDSNGITVTDVNGNNITLDSNGIAITDLNNNSITLDSNGIAATDANNNSIEMSSSGVTTQDAAGNKVELSSSGVTTQDAAGNKVELSSSGVTIQDAAGNKAVLQASGPEISSATGAKISLGTPVMIQGAAGKITIM